MLVRYDDITFDNRQPTQVADAIFNIITKYDSRFSHTAGTDTIRVSGFDIVFSYYNTGGATRSRIDGRDFINSSGIVNYTTMLIITDTIFYLLFKTQNAANTPVTGFSWIRENGINYFGVAAYNSSVGQIDSMNFTNKTNGGTYYTIKKHAQFSFNGQNILFIPTSIISDNGGNYQVLSGLRSCSNVTFNTMVSVNYSNYYAIGTNTLIRDDGVD